jgi:hypothetical protein
MAKSGRYCLASSVLASSPTPTLNGRYKGFSVGFLPFRVGFCPTLKTVFLVVDAIVIVYAFIIFISSCSQWWYVIIQIIFNFIIYTQYWPLQLFLVLTR